MNYILENDKDNELKLNLTYYNKYFLREYLDRLNIKSYNPTSNQTIIKNNNLHLFLKKMKFERYLFQKIR